MSTQVCYRKLRNYKYQVMKEYEHETELRLEKAVGSRDDWVRLETDGTLRFKKGYAWDGPSGPTIDTKTFMRGSLVHDGLYQLMREGQLDPERRKYADRLLRQICREDGMSRIRASYVYRSLRWFGAKHARPTGNSGPPTICVP